MINNGTPQYADAYFEIQYIRAFSTNSSAVVSSNGSSVPTGQPNPSATGPGSSPTGGPDSGKPGAALALSPQALYASLTVVSLLALAIL